MVYASHCIVVSCYYKLLKAAGCKHIMIDRSWFTANCFNLLNATVCEI